MDNDLHNVKEAFFTIYGLPKTKSNHSLVNKQGKKILPKNSPYALYEKQIVNSIYEQIGDKVFSGKIICWLYVYFKHKDKHPDLNNMPKSICDGIEKSGIIKNDRSIVNVYLEERYDYDNPRVEVAIYDYTYYKPVVTILKRTDEEMAKIEQDNIKQVKVPKQSKTCTSLICSICEKKITDRASAKKINGKNEYICLKCILLGI